MTLDTTGRILRAKIKLGKSKPFYAYLLSFMKLHEEKTIPTMGVAETGDLYYNPEWIEKLNDDELQGVLTHEVCHVSFGHFFRNGSRDHELFNVANDIVINNILINDGITLPNPQKHGGLIPNNNRIELIPNKLIISDIDKKTSEEIYDIIYKKVPKIKVSIGSPSQSKGQDKNDGEGEGGFSTFDKHIHSNKKEKDKNNGGNKPSEKNGKIIDGRSELEKEWNKRLIDAQTHAISRGIIPRGIDRLIDSLVNNKVSWKRLLQKYITNEVFTDWTWSKMSRKSHAIGTYLPSARKENVEIAVAIDTSGSIRQEELTQFLSEIVHIVKSTSNVKCTIMECDCAIHQELEVRNGEIKKILEMKIKGGGGTDHKPVYDRMLQKYKNIKVLVNFTDGYTSTPIKNNYPFETIWVLTKGGSDEVPKKFGGKIIKMD